MPAVLGAERLADCTYFGVVYRLFQRVYIAERSDPAQFTAGLLYVRIRAQFASYLIKGLNRQTFLDGFPFSFYFFLLHLQLTNRYTLVGFVYLRQRISLRSTIGISRTLDGNMCCTAILSNTCPTQRDDTIHRSVVLHVFGSSLCAVAFQLFLECFGRVDTLRFSFCHFQFEVNEHLQILIHRLRVQSAGLVVLLVDIQELPGTYCLAVNCHQGLIRTLSRCC